MKSENLNKNLSLNCNGKLIDLSTPKVMGILNITPDSFYDGGRFKAPKSILAQAEKLLTEGATFLDNGAYSSRPGADFVSEEEELNRIVPVIELIVKHFPECLISIDSFRSKVMRECAGVGAGTPQTMRKLTTYNHLMNDVYAYFSERIQCARNHGITDLIIDPGFGFAKTQAQNYKLLGQLDFFTNLNCPILAGVSRKSMIYKVLDCTPSEALNGTTALNMTALLNGSQILRVHDVKEAAECIKLFNQL